MRYKFIVPLFLTLFAISCNNNDKGDYVDESIMPPGQSSGVSNAPASTGAQPPLQMQNPAMQPVQVNPQTVSTNGSVKLNPKHGEPGHRCDIPDGAPLDSKPSVTSTPVATNPAVTQISSPTQKTAPGMNPAHGQPGHRCDIAVGAPLNSKPATPAKTEGTPVQVTPGQATPAAIKAEETKAAEAVPSQTAEEPKKEGGN